MLRQGKLPASQIPPGRVKHLRSAYQRLPKIRAKVRRLPTKEKRRRATRKAAFNRHLRSERRATVRAITAEEMVAATVVEITAIMVAAMATAIVETMATETMATTATETMATTATATTATATTATETMETTATETMETTATETMETTATGIINEVPGPQFS